MKEILTRYAAYNHWANSQFVENFLLLDDELLKANSPGSFNSLYKTLVHIWEAENIWWRRLNLEENVPVPGFMEELPVQEVGRGLLQQSQMIAQWVLSARAEKIDHVIAYRNSKKIEFKQPVYEVLLHLFNHQTYHRGQLVSMMHHMNISKIPNSDYIAWSRKNKIE